MKKDIEILDKDKIEFAIEKLQETKKALREKVCLMENNEHCYPQNAIHWQDVVAIIDYQNQKINVKKDFQNPCCIIIV